ncbi:MAG: hypothetical protein NW201_05170 [Gemmatimonadales bacterium]|nr:hypothetical protein [Gemmatimonadales bacterium]
MNRAAVAGIWGALLVVTAVAAPLPAQGTIPSTRIELKENVPNPVDSTTSIPFDIFTEGCNKGRKPRVTLKVYNVLVQEVATPVLVVGRSKERLDDLKLTCGEYRAFWDGRTKGDKPAQPGVYYYQLVVDGQSLTRKLIMRRAPPMARE